MALARLAVLAAATALTASTAPAHATELEVTGDTAVQGYEITSPWGDVTLDRRRFMQTVGLGLYNLQGQYHPGEADYRVVMSLRIDADFGINARLPAAQAGGETNFATPAGNGVRFIPGLQAAPVDLMFGYVEGRNLAHGLFGFRVGRQYMTDILGWWAFDGALVRVTTPYFVQVEAYGGLEERGGLPLSTSRFERQGVWRGNHDGFDNGSGTPSLTQYPSFLDAHPAPAYGVVVESHGPSWVHGRFSYRKVFNTGDVLTTQFPDPAGGYRAIGGLRTSQERLGWAGDVSKSDLGQLKGGFTYDLYNQIVASYFAGAEAYLAGKRVTLGADADYFVPTFDGDSIWNWFTHGPITTVTGRVAGRITKRFDVTASGGARLWWAQGDPSTGPGTGGLSKFGFGECRAQLGPTGNCQLGQVSTDPSGAAAQSYLGAAANRVTTTTPDAIGNLNARYKFASGDVALKGMVETGARGSREGADVSGEKRWDGGRYTTGARVSLYGWADPLRPDRDATSFGYVLTGGFKPFSVAKVRLEWEQDMNRLVGQRYRVMAVLNVRVLK